MKLLRVLKLDCGTTFVVVAVAVVVVVEEEGSDGGFVLLVVVDDDDDAEADDKSLAFLFISFLVVGFVRGVGWVYWVGSA
jgi:hypothetical protein